MRFLVRLSPTDSSSEEILASIRTLAKSTGADIRNPKWTSKGSLEVDVFVPAPADLELFISAVKPLYNIQFVHDLSAAPSYKPESELLAEAWDYFNSERYWECHETLEGLWKVKDDEEKRFLQGVILICAAFVHHQKGEDGIAMGVLRRASKQLEFSLPTYHGVDLYYLRSRVSGILENAKFETFPI